MNTGKLIAMLKEFPFLKEILLKDGGVTENYDVIIYEENEIINPNEIKVKKADQNLFGVEHYGYEDGINSYYIAVKEKDDFNVYPLDCPGEDEDAICTPSIGRQLDYLISCGALFLSYSNDYIVNIKEERAENHVRISVTIYKLRNYVTPDYVTY